MAEVKRDIQDRFDANLARVDGLVKLFQAQAGGRGRAAVVETDILRAAVILLHASLEDLLRSLSELILPGRPVTVFEEWGIGLPSNPDKRPQKLTLPNLLEFRGKTIDEVLDVAIQQHLERSSYNNFAEVERTLTQLGLDPTPLKNYGPNLSALMKRRHHIAHRADRNSQMGRGQYNAQHLSDATVLVWKQSVHDAGLAILNQVH